MKKILLSNPPFNVPYEEEMNLQLKYPNLALKNAGSNLIFLLISLELSSESFFILPTSVLESSRKKVGKEIIKYLVDNNLLEGVIEMPDNMFESTGVRTVVIKLNKNKADDSVYLIDLSNEYEVIERNQKGQFGGKSHTNREYIKKLNAVPDEVIKRVNDYIKNNSNEKFPCEKVRIDEIKEKDYSLRLCHYLDIDLYFDKEQDKHRSIKEIVKSVNSIIKEKNNCKLTINETLGKKMGFDKDTFIHMDFDEFNKNVEKFDSEKILKEDYISFTKNKNEIKLENKDKEHVSSILIMAISMYKQHLYYLNEKHNEYLCELRDALLPKLMSGEIVLD